MGGHFDGFHFWIATNEKETQLDFRSSQHSDKECTFIFVHTMYQAADIAIIFISEIVRLHGIPKRIISDQGSAFT
jgi:hypothetical protein